MTKAIIVSYADGVDVRVGWDEQGANEEEKALAIELSFVLDEYLRLKKKGGAK